MGRASDRWLAAFFVSALTALSSGARAEQTLELALAQGPHAPADAPDVMVHLPTRLDPRAPIHWLIFLHGYSSCARALMASQPAACKAHGALQRPYGLAELHERAQTNSILVVPQLAFMARDPRAPRFEQAHGLARFIDELRQRLKPHLGAAEPPSSITLLAHSAGYRAAAGAVRSAPPYDVDNVVLFDALYARWDVFAAWWRASPGHRLISLHTRDRATTEGNARLVAALGPRARSDAARLTITKVDTPHGLVPERHLHEVLRALFAGPARENDRSTRGRAPSP